MTRRILFPLGLVIALAVLPACNGDDGGGGGDNSAGAPVGRVAVVSLDEVAGKLGQTAAWKKELSAYQEQLKDELMQRKEALQNKVDEFEKSLPETPTDEQKKQLRDMLMTANREMVQADRRQGQKLQARRNELLNNFREQMKTLTLKVARDKGFTIVLTKAGSVLATDPGADITQAVLEAAFEANMNISSEKQ
ncbi:MAG: OmpH family outer membrane protein [Planctomycetota bacterium]